MGRDARQPAAAPAVFPAVLAGVAAGQCRRRAGGEFSHHAVGARLCPAALGASAASRSLAPVAVDDAARLACRVAGVATAGTAFMGHHDGCAGRRLLLLPRVSWSLDRRVPVVAGALPPPPKPPRAKPGSTCSMWGRGWPCWCAPRSRALLYDTGPLYSAEANAGQRVVVPFLRAVGVRQIDTLVVSHRDKDHSGGLGAVQAHGLIGRTLSSLPELNGELCASGQSWEWDGIRFSVLHPVADDYAAHARRGKRRTT